MEYILNIRALLLAAVTHLLVLLGYALLTPLAHVIAEPDSAAYVYVQQEFIVLAELVGSLVPAFILAKFSKTNPWVAAAALRVIAFMPSFFFFSDHMMHFLSSRPVSYHITFVVLSGVCAGLFWELKASASQRKE